jgi:Flp pilus assembly protein TadG
MSNFKSMFRNFANNCKGSIAIYFGLLFVPLTMGLGVAIDVSRASYTQTTLQSAADAAALAGAANKKLTPGQLQKIVSDYAAANGAPNVVASIKQLDSSYNSEVGTFTVHIKGRMQTSLMAMAGIKELDVGVQSVVTTGSRALDLALALDVTGSMGLPMGSGTRLKALKASASRLLTILETEKSSYAVLRVGVVPFAEYVNVGNIPNVLGKAPGWEGCVGSPPSPRDTDPAIDQVQYAVTPAYCPAVRVMPLTSDLEDVKETINELEPAGNTYVPAGVQWGTQLLTEEGPFTEGMSDAEMSQLQGFKYLVVMTDGKNTIGPVYPTHDTSQVAQADKKTTESCNAAKTQGIEVFTITFMVTDPTIQTVMTGCATNPSMSFDADNASQLDAAFTTIGQKLASLRLQK